MNGEPIFSRRLLVGWIAGAVAVFAASLYLLAAGEPGGPDSTDANTYSRSAIGHAGIAEILQRLGIPVVKSRYNSLEKLSRGSVLVIAEPHSGRQSEAEIRTLLKADRVLLVLPKWAGQASERKAGWLRNARERPLADAQQSLRLVIPRGEVVREEAVPRWSVNLLGPTPSPLAPVQLVRAANLRPIVAAGRDILVGELREGNRRLWVLSDPDIISNHGLAREGNAALVVALINRLREGDGSVVFDETVHGYVARPTNPFMLLFRFPFVVATVQGLIALGLLMWATIGRFGAPQVLPPALRVGRGSLLESMAHLVEGAGHRPIMVARYVRETVRDVARQLRAPATLTPTAQLAWLVRVGKARGATVDCGDLMRRADGLATAGRGDARRQVRLARDTYRWRKEILDGRASHPRRH